MKWSTTDTGDIWWPQESTKDHKSRAQDSRWFTAKSPPSSHTIAAFFVQPHPATWSWAQPLPITAHGMSTHGGSHASSSKSTETSTNFSPYLKRLQVCIHFDMLMYKRYVDCWSIVYLYKLQIKRAHLSWPQKDVLKMLKAKKDSRLETGMSKTCKVSCVRNKLGSLGQA